MLSALIALAHPPHPQNGWIGAQTPLDVQGFDYSTGSYDGWHRGAPNIPSISSETSSAVSDRGEYVNNETAGHVQAYDNQVRGRGRGRRVGRAGVMRDAQGLVALLTHLPHVPFRWQYPGWGESAEQAWGGVGVSAGQGILTRAFISGGWTWTGWCVCGWALVPFTSPT